jgi:hypothetical protein
MSHEVKVPIGSVEYLYVDIKTDRQLDSQAVEIALSVDLPPTVWLSAEWQGSAGTFRSARVLLDGTLAKGVYDIWARITDNPETPIIHAGRLRVHD